ncbi:hypothetical protein GPECTOR_4g805 [Gonium pectorale]|uniref:Uncharacterized protein n=1 Tax=Gonium pectorale TaxID=33097 RepID=A0A150GXU7_GONPE|nr:hypothetical protein GPECTOR_4g805 [Gonium pectorale]|eukprot:KXZ54736.1 hypothetical protein GPECTOR_4g805 [Gonium pectorale]
MVLACGSASGARACARSARCSMRVWPQLPLELTELIVSFMERNEVATSFRLVNKAAAAQFCGPEHTTIRLSRPVPHHVFAAHWLSPGATRRLTLVQRQRLLFLTAASGAVYNMEAATEAAGCGLTYVLFHQTAEAGSLGSCQWLLQQGCPTSIVESWGSGLLAAAAGGGHQHVCEWLLSLDLVWRSLGDVEAARGGHVGLMEWLQQRRPQLRIQDSLGNQQPSGEQQMADLVEAVAYGCDLAALRRHWRGWGRLTKAQQVVALEAAACSPTPDWAAKVEWLESQACSRGEEAVLRATLCPDAAARLAWLRGRGYNVRFVVADTASGRSGLGSLAALQALHGACSAGDAAGPAAAAAAGLPSPRDLARCAARGGALHVLVWLVEAFGAEAVALDAELFALACLRGNVELMGWMAGRGCAIDAGAYRTAAESGCEEALEWLAARGCPMPGDGGPYFAVCANGDRAAARCLQRLGCPWGPAGELFERLVRERAPVTMMRWLLEAGCPADVGAARAQVSGGGRWAAELLRLLEERRAAA